ncbi:hypothetical protein SOD_c18560 [Serratia plymuthica 4Rx13]|nr:hypothetical protein SOD_c18560 [Serratia plymuthica 4Rx13]
MAVAAQPTDPRTQGDPHRLAENHPVRGPKSPGASHDGAYRVPYPAPDSLQYGRAFPGCITTWRMENP